MTAAPTASRSTLPAVDHSHLCSDGSVRSPARHPAPRSHARRRCLPIYTTIDREGTAAAGDQRLPLSNALTYRRTAGRIAGAVTPPAPWTATLRLLDLTLVLIIAAVEAQQLPVAAVGRIVVVVADDGRSAVHRRSIELACAAGCARRGTATPACRAGIGEVDGALGRRRRAARGRAHPPARGPFAPLLYIHARRGLENEDRQQDARTRRLGFRRRRARLAIRPVPRALAGARTTRQPRRDVEAALDHLAKRTDACRIPAGIVGYSRGPYLRAPDCTPSARRTSPRSSAITATCRTRMRPSPTSCSGSRPKCRR